MERSSRQVSTPQRTTHPRLRDLLLRHRATPWREPLAPHNARAIETLQERLENDDRALVLDSYCGTGQSTQLLALRYPECLVIGIDKSAHRLAKHAHAPNSDYCLVQADCEPLWLFLAQAGYSLKAHYLL